jgi:hypothetical protein
MLALAKAWALTALCLVLCSPWAASHASALRYCDRQAALSAEQKDRLLRLGAIIKAELEDSGRSLALVSRSGLDLGRFGVRYSHAGVSLKASANTPWSVRQLYYACDEHKPRVFDQGISGFLLDLNDPSAGYVSVVLLPAAEAAALERVALDNGAALQLLAPRYSANAYPFSVSYQNCNQWVVEMLAAAWGGLGGAEDLRARAQRWLMESGYAPTVFEIGFRPLVWLAAFNPWLHQDDQPADDLARMKFHVSMPASVEAFVHAMAPAATRIEFCLAGRRVVVRRGWDPIADGCQPAEQDTVITLD